MPTHPDGSVDGRYTLTTEWGGHHVPVWVARFGGEWITSDVDEFRAWQAVTLHDRERRESLGIA
jgi:hypothetical protein